MMEPTQQQDDRQSYVMEAAMPVDTAWEMWRGLTAVASLSPRLSAEVSPVADDVLRRIMSANGPVIVIPISWDGARTIYGMTGAITDLIARDPEVARQRQLTTAGMIAIRQAIREYRTIVAQLIGMRCN